MYIHTCQVGIVLATQIKDTVANTQFVLNGCSLVEVCPPNFFQSVYASSLVATDKKALWV